MSTLSALKRAYRRHFVGDEHDIGIKTCSTVKTLSIMFGECLKSINFAIELEIEGMMGKGVALLLS